MRSCGYDLCFLPQGTEGRSSNGLIPQISLWDTEKCIMVDPKTKHGLTKEAEGFLGGIYHHMTALLQFVAPSSNSLKRIAPSKMVGAYKIWGIENKEAPLNLQDSLKIKDNMIQKFELRIMDPSCNLFLAMAAILAVGIRGMN